jgi:hypothetical protein
VAGKSPSLVIVLGAHGFDETRCGLGVTPEQPVRRDAPGMVVDHQVEIGAVERRLTKARLGIRAVPLEVDHVMRTRHRLEATGQPIPRTQGADLWSSVGCQPRLDQPVFLNGKAMADQDLLEDVVGTVDFEAADVQAVPTSVCKPALDDMGDPVRGCVGHDDWVELHPAARVGCDHGGFRATVMVEPEQLREVVGRARPLRPPPLQVGGFVQPCGGVSAADPLQQRRRAGQVVETDAMRFSQRAHPPNLWHRRADDTWSSAVKRGSVRLPPSAGRCAGRSVS